MCIQEQITPDLTILLGKLILSSGNLANCVEIANFHNVLVLHVPHADHWDLLLIFLAYSFLLENLLNIYNDKQRMTFPLSCRVGPSSYSLMEK